MLLVCAESDEVCHHWHHRVDRRDFVKHTVKRVREVGILADAISNCFAENGTHATDLRPLPDRTGEWFHLRNP